MKDKPGEYGIERSLSFGWLHPGYWTSSSSASSDLSILGAEVTKFDEYDRAMRTGILASFLQRERIYHTAFFRSLYEAAARANLQRAIERLRAP